MKKNAQNFIDLSGKIINNWKVIRDTGKRKRRSPIWECICLVCNQHWEVNGNSLRNNSKRCRNCFYKTVKGKPKTLTSDEEVKKNVYARYRCEAKKRKLSFELDFQMFKTFIENECFYCSIKNFSYQKANNGDIIRFNGIDRVDNTKGYILENCVSCCKLCNTYKKSITPEMIKKAYNFLGNYPLTTSNKS